MLYLLTPSSNLHFGVDCCIIFLAYTSCICRWFCSFHFPCSYCKLLHSVGFPCCTYRLLVYMRFIYFIVSCSLVGSPVVDIITATSKWKWHSYRSEFNRVRSLPSLSEWWGGVFFVVSGRSRIFQSQGQWHVRRALQVKDSCQVHYDPIDFKLMVQKWRNLDITLAKDILVNKWSSVLILM